MTKGSAVLFHASSNSALIAFLSITPNCYYYSATPKHKSREGAYATIGGFKYIATLQATTGNHSAGPMAGLRTAFFSLCYAHNVITFTRFDFSSDLGLLSIGTVLRVDYTSMDP